jgi:hypothetical protein
MSQSLFVQVQGDTSLIEVPVGDSLTEAELLAALESAGVVLGPELAVFIDECEEPLSGDRERRVGVVKDGCRVHVARCRRIKTVVHFMEKTLDRELPPGARVRAVKKWAVHELHLDHKDAAEHVLQLCGSSVRPASDTPLHVLVQNHERAVCFDLVPEKRIEGDR